MIGRLKRFWRQPPTRRWQRLSFLWSGWVTRFWHGPRLCSLGRRSIIQTPLFWTPEYIEVGTDVLVWPGCRFEGIALDPASAGTSPRIVLGDNVVLQQYCHITAAGQLSIGAGTLMSFNVSIQDTDHRYDDIACSVTHQPLTYAQTTIGENCFIGARASIQAGTRLGRHCIVGANAVVRGSYPDYCVLVGAPARIVKRYDLETATWRRTAPDGSFLKLTLTTAEDPFSTYHLHDSSQVS